MMSSANAYTIAGSTAIIIASLLQMVRGGDFTRWQWTQDCQPFAFKDSGFSASA
jgi:transcriptional regulator of nitric oxide reductase